jgi:hypothetical protein
MVEFDLVCKGTCKYCQKKIDCHISILFKQKTIGQIKASFM